MNNVNVLVTKSDKSDISGYGDPKAFLEQINYIFGDQVFIGAPHSPAFVRGSRQRPNAQFLRAENCHKIEGE